MPNELTSEAIDRAWLLNNLAEIEAHVRSLPPFEDAVLAPSIVLKLIEIVKEACK